MKKLLPNKNHKIFLKELCALINDFYKVSDYRNNQEVLDMLKKRLPLLLNNFDKTDPMFEPVASMLTDVFKNLSTVIKFIREE